MGGKRQKSNYADAEMPRTRWLLKMANARWWFYNVSA